MNKEVRVRFAPSPTGPLHIGGVRTALYNFLFAKKHGGKFILRIEDTDQTRYVTGAETYIKESLKWCGMAFDEGPDEGGSFTPYRQSERKSMYGKYARKLIDDGNAYYAFDTPDELEAMRKRLRGSGVPNPQYNIITRASMRNSLTLPKEETEELINSGAPYVIRLKIPRKEEIRLNDMIRGWVLVHSSAVDDKVLMKSDGMPTYHLANVVDDHLMKITHVIRGEEWLPSAPLHVLLYKYLGWEEEMPQFAHLPLLLKPDGNGKLSKRDAEKHGFPLFPTDWQDPETGEKASGFKEAGYLPEALVNFLAFLGWNPGTQKELFTLEELINEFSVERIGKSGVKFDIEKAKWYNQQYLRKKSDEELAELLLKYLEKEGIECTVDKAAHVSRLMKERATFPHELWSEGQYFFRAPKTFDEKTVNSKWNADAVDVINEFVKKITELPSFDAESIRSILHEITEEKELKLGKVLPAVRLSVTGVGFGPDLMQIMEIIGREETIRRMETALNQLES